MMKLIAVMGLLVSFVVGQSTTVHDEINHRNTTVSCGSNGDCSVYDQDQEDASRDLNKQAVTWCRANHVPWKVSRHDPAAFPHLDGFNRYASESCWQAYQKSQQPHK